MINLPASLIAFYNSEKIKNQFITRIKGKIAKGKLLHNEKHNSKKGEGNLISSTIKTDNPYAYVNELGIPLELVYLQMTIFNGLSKQRAEQFAVDFLKVIPVGANLASVYQLLSIRRQEFILSMLKSNKEEYAQQAINAIKLAIEWQKDNKCSDSKKVSDLAYSVYNTMLTMKTESLMLRESARFSVLSAHQSLAYSSSLFMESVILTIDSAATAVIARSVEVQEWATEIEWHELSLERLLGKKYSISSEVTKSWMYREENIIAKQAHYEWEASALLDLLSKAPITKTA